MDLELLSWRVDPDGGWFWRWPWRLIDEAIGVGAEGVIEGFLAGGVDLVGLAVVDLVGRHQADAQVMMVLVVPVEEGSAKGLGVLDRAEALGYLWLIFEGLEAAFREGVIVGGVGPAVGFGDAQIGEQQGGGLGLHGRSAVGMQGELACRDGMIVDGAFEQGFEKGGALGVGDAPAHRSSSFRPECEAPLRCAP